MLALRGSGDGTTTELGCVRGAEGAKEAAGQGGDEAPQDPAAAQGRAGRKARAAPSQPAEAPAPQEAPAPGQDKVFPGPVSCLSIQECCVAAVCLSWKPWLKP